MSSVLVDKARSYSHTKNRSTKLANVVSPKIVTKSSPEKPKHANRTGEYFPSLDPTTNESLGKASNKSKVNSTLKNEYATNQNIFQNQTYRLDHNFLNHLQSIGVSVGQETEPNHSFTEILKIKQVNFQATGANKKTKGLELPYTNPSLVGPLTTSIKTKKNSKNKKKKAIEAGLDSSFEKVADYNKDQISTERINRTSFSNLKTGKFDTSIGQNYDESSNDEQKGERKIHSATEKTDLKSTRNKRTTSESPLEGKISKRSEDSYNLVKKYASTTQNIVKANSDSVPSTKLRKSSIRLGPLDSIKEVVSKKALPTINSKTNSNLIAAHKASASSLNNNGNSPYGAQTKIDGLSSPLPISNTTSPLAVVSIANKQITPTNNNTQNAGANANRMFQSQSPAPPLKTNSSSNNLSSSRNFSPQVNRTLNNKSMMVSPQMNNSSAQKDNMTQSQVSNTQSTTGTNRTGMSQSMVSQTSSVVSGSTAVTKPYYYANANAMQQTTQDIRKKYVVPQNSNKFKYFIGGGNNAELVEKVMARRDWWEKTEGFNTLFNFKWQQTHRGYKYERLIANQSLKQCVNHFENHKEISTKNLLIKNLSSHCELNKINLFDLTPTTFTFDMDDETNFDSDMQRFAKFFLKHGANQGKSPKSEAGDKKSHNVWYEFDYRKKKGYQAPVLSNGNGKKKSPYLKPKIHKTFVKGQNIWILKPTGFNRGIGIEVFNSLEKLNEFLNVFMDGTKTVKKDKKAKNPEDDSDTDDDEDDKKKNKGFQGQTVKSHTFVIQKYIENLLLIKGRKFDIRVWCMVTQEMQLYFFKEGYLRMSSTEFDLSDVENKFIHLTNNAVQKYADNFGQFENGNQLSFNNFQKYCEENGLPQIDVQGKVIPRMKELIQISMQSIKRNLNPYDRKYCFEIFGYDFMIDMEGNVWLIEVNTNPCIEESSPILQQYIPRMLDDAFKMTIDVLFPPPKKPANNNNNKSNPLAAKNMLEVKVDSEIVPKTENNVMKIEGDESKEDKSNVQADIKEDSPAIINNKEGNDDKTNVQQYKVNGYPDDESMWEFLCSLKVEKMEKGSPTKKPTKVVSNVK